jgi:hypothetical protein
MKELCLLKRGADIEGKNAGIWETTIAANSIH